MKSAEELAAEVDGLIESTNQPPETGNKPETTPPAAGAQEGEENPLKDKVTEMVSQIEAGLKDQEGPVVEFITKYVLANLTEAQKAISGEIKAEELAPVGASTDLSATVSEMQGQLDIARDQASASEANAKAAEGKVTALEAQNATLTKQAMEFAKFARTQAAAHLANLKVLLGGAEAASKESLVTEFAEKKLSELISEIKAVEATMPNQPRTPNTVEPPKGEEADRDDAGKQEEGKDKPLTVDDATQALAKAFTRRK